MVKDKKMLITGADGFVGSNLCYSLIKENLDVTAFLRKSSKVNPLNIQEIKDEIKIIYGDLRDFDTLDKACRDIEVLYHLGAQSHVPDSVKQPFTTFNVNALGTLNCLEAARKNDVEYFVNAGSDKIYGDPIYLPIDEKHPLRPRSPYDASKISGESLCLSYYKTYGINVFLPRFSNIYGPRQDSRKVIPDFIHRLIEDNPPIIKSDGSPIRDYLYIEDAISVYRIIIDFPSVVGEFLNFGTGVGTTVKKLCEMIIEISGKKMEPIILGRTIIGEIKEQYLNITKAKNTIKWTPKYDLYNGLSRTWEWYMNNKNFFFS